MITVEAIRFTQEGLTHVCLDEGDPLCGTNEDIVRSKSWAPYVYKRQVSKLVDCLECRLLLGEKSLK